MVTEDYHKTVQGKNTFLVASENQKTLRDVEKHRNMMRPTEEENCSIQHVPALKAI